MTSGNSEGGFQGLLGSNGNQVMQWVMWGEKVGESQAADWEHGREQLW